MKKLFSFASLSAIAFFGAVSFSACSSSDEVVENNPNYNPETNAVKTEFVINVTQPNERTRMLADNAGAGAFQGINNMKLLCLTSAIDNEITTAKSLTLNTYNSSPAIDNTDNTLTNSSSSVYTMYIPVGTTNFLFYATASIPSTNDKFAKGSLVNNLATATTVATATPAASDIKFNLESIQSTEASVTTPQSKLLTVLNGIAAASYDKNETPNDATDDITWASTTSKTEVQWTALKNAFYQFTNQVGANSGDIRQGSSAAILNMVVDLFGAVNDVYTNEVNAEAKGVAKAILDAIKTYFNVTLTGTTYTWESPAYNSDYNVNYPENLNLPTGSAVIVYNNNAFSFVNNGQMGTSAVSVAYNNFTYPSQLTYYCNSGLWQTTTGKNNNTTDWPQTSAAWVTAANWSGWNTGAVTAATRAVAMKDNITYGAAQLVSTIKLAENVGTTTAPLVDNAAAVTNNVEANKSFDGSTADKTITLKVHGLLIGGQPDAAQYEYLPQGTTFNKVIYDKFSTDGQTVNSTGYTNYTLALDNFLASTTATSATQNTVNVALEMTADKDFYGASGKIKSGQKFYLIGSLDPASGGDITWADHTSFKSGDTGQGVNRVFIRDAKTVATFTLGANCLKNAYSTIPDLRSTQMLFGISVDLAWKAGLVFDVNIGQ